MRDRDIALLPSRPGARRIFRGHAGTTSLEVVVVSGIFMFFTTGLFSLFLTSMRSWDMGSSKAMCDSSASIALQRAVRQIMDGMSATYTNGVLTVQMPSTNDQGDYVRTATGDQVKLYVTNGTLFRQINTTTPVAVASRITGWNAVPGNGTVTLTITAQERTGKTAMQTQFSQVVALRNFIGD
jgi:hypothetical protein